MILELVYLFTSRKLAGINSRKPLTRADAEACIKDRQTCPFCTVRTG